MATSFVPLNFVFLSKIKSRLCGSTCLLIQCYNSEGNLKLVNLKPQFLNCSALWEWQNIQAVKKRCFAESYFSNLLIICNTFFVGLINYLSFTILLPHIYLQVRCDWTNEKFKWVFLIFLSNSIFSFASKQ